MFPLEQHKLIHTLISKVVVFEDKIQIHFEAAGLAGLLKEAGADEAVLKLKSLEAFEKVADGQATTILLPAELQGIASLAAAWK